MVMHQNQIKWNGNIGKIVGEEHFTNFKPRVEFNSPSGEQKEFKCVGSHGADLVYVHQGEPGTVFYVFVLRVSNSW